MFMRRIIRYTFFLVAVLVLLVGALAYYTVLRPNTSQVEPVTMKVGAQWSYEDLTDALVDDVLDNPLGFDILAEQMNLSAHVYPGIYEFSSGLNNRQIITQLRTGKTKDVPVVIRSHIQGNDVFGILASNLEADSADIEEAFVQSDIYKDLGMKGDAGACLFQANTYKFNWASTPESIVERFRREYNSFWTAQRQDKAGRQNLSPVEVSVLASIVDGESTDLAEMPKIAGVYLNRLRNRWPLQADPTIMFFVREEGRQRVLNADKEKDHPYNTYLRQGLPPGPIMIPSSTAIKAVLEPAEHDYMFFCANPDFSQTHLFAKSLSEHNRNAAAYHRALNLRGIRR